jgi:AraC-type DNA-binding domain-containing proteins
MEARRGRALRGRWSCSTPTRSTTDGRGSGEGFGYRIIYLEPSHLSDALRAHCGRPYPLPFVREPVATNPRLSRAIQGAFRFPLEPLAVDSLTLDLAEGLLDGERGGGRPSASPRVDAPGIERARQFLDAERTRVVHSTELEAITGLTRYDLARQFRLMFGTSPYRYLLMRRLELARQRIHAGPAGRRGRRDRLRRPGALHPRVQGGLRPHARALSHIAGASACLASRGAPGDGFPAPLSRSRDGAILPS